jgi:hypothetical protein
MKVVFLDIDGVLNSDDWDRRRIMMSEYLDFIGDWDYWDFDPLAVKILNSITDSTSAKIVISSTWRTFYDFDVLLSKLVNVGVTGDIIAYTPRISFDVPRGCEIKKYLDDSGTVDCYVILDDDPDMLQEQIKSFVRINPNSGLTQKDARKAIEILNKKPDV